MTIYSFWSADKTYYTKSKNLKKAQTIGKENMEHYLKTCEYLEEQPQVGKEYFIPEEIVKVSIEEFNYSIKTDSDTIILDDKLYSQICK